MSKEFNITGTCIPEMHYMVDTGNKLDSIMKLIEGGRYFTINRPRQYGKTTTLYLLSRLLGLNVDYLLFRISFEGIGDVIFEKEEQFSTGLLDMLSESILMDNEEIAKYISEQAKEVKSLKDVSAVITKLVKKTEKKVVLMIDEVDKSSNNQILLSFLGMLRNKYLLRNEGRDFTFHSVILTGVHDVKSLKQKIRSDKEQKYNSPWNIAVDFNIELSFTAMEIATMLVQYVHSKGVIMDVEAISEKLYFYTSGYPYLVSKLCKLIDEKIMGEKLKWEQEYIDQAVGELVKESNTNFDILIKNLENNKSLYKIVYDIIIKDADISYNVHNPDINMGIMCGVFKCESGLLKIHNRVYEQLIYDYMSSKIQTSIGIGGYNFRGEFIETDGSLNFEKILVKFQEFMKSQYIEKNEKFIEENGRLVFLAFLKPIINGRGFDFKEVQVSEEKRLDIVITYLDKRYVVELKIWHGQKAHEKGIKQLKDYLDRTCTDNGYLVIYDLRKTGKKEWKQDCITLDGSSIFMVWV